MSDENQRPDTGLLSEQVARAAEAEQLRKNPMFDAAFESVRETLTQGFFDSDGKPENLERIYLMNRLTDNLKQFFINHMNNGKASAQLLLDIQKANPKPKEKDDE